MSELPKVTRYGLNAACGNATNNEVELVCDESPDGEWVKYEDYERKEKAWKRVHESMRLEIAKWEREARRLGCMWAAEESSAEPSAVTVPLLPTGPMTPELIAEARRICEASGLRLAEPATQVEVDAYEIEDALRIARLWRGGKMIGGNEDAVRNALLAEVERLHVNRPAEPT